MHLPQTLLRRPLATSDADTLAASTTGPRDPAGPGHRVLRRTRRQEDSRIAAPPSCTAASDTCGVLGLLPPGLVDESVWTSERPPPKRFERVVPTGYGQIVFDLDSGAGLLVGIRTLSAVVDPPLRARGVRLSGAGVYAIVGPDVASTVDQAIDLTTIVPAATLRQLRDSGIAPDALADLVVKMCSRHRADPRVVRAEQALRHGATSRAVERDAAMDRRRFVPLFRSQIGISPNAYHRLVRFADTIASLRTCSRDPIAVIAAKHGYADQAHLTRDVRQLARTTPGKVVKLPVGPINHLPADDTTR